MFLGISWNQCQFETSRFQKVRLFLSLHCTVTPVKGPKSLWGRTGERLTVKLLGIFFSRFFRGRNLFIPLVTGSRSANLTQVWKFIPGPRFPFYHNPMKPFFRSFERFFHLYRSNKNTVGFSSILCPETPGIN